MDEILKENFNNTVKISLDSEMKNQRLLYGNDYQTPSPPPLSTTPSPPSPPQTTPVQSLLSSAT